MSKLIERLERTSEAQAAPLGFGAARARQKAPSMVLIARLSGPESKSIKAAQDIADGLLITVKDWDQAGAQLKHLAKAAGEAPWGVQTPCVTVENVTSLIEAGADFVVFNESGTPAAVLNEEKIGKVIEVDSEMQDTHLRVAGQIPVGAAMTGIGEISTLTVHQSMVVQRVAALVHKPLLITVPAEMGSQDLQALCRAGVKGVVVDAEVEGSRENLTRLKEAIAAMPVSKKTGSEKIHAILPSVAPPAAEPQEDEEEEEDD